jgi:peptidoglycan-associated lipoprotein
MKTIRFALIPVLALALSSCANLKKKGGVDADGDYVSGTPLPDREEGASFMGANVDKSRFEPVYFGYDSFSVAGAELDKVELVSEALKGSRNTVIIAGFTDERGTAEYNRALGERRAQSVREELIRRGVPGDRLQTVSFGEEMPADSGGGEEAWARNRRAEFGVVK